MKKLCRFKYKEMTEIRKQLNEELANVEWSSLIPHAKRDAVIVVEEGLDLLDVGVAIAKDDFVTVESWISEQLIHKPDANELMAWNSEPSKQFVTLIVQPFVVVQAAEE